MLPKTSEENFKKISEKLEISEKKLVKGWENF